MNSRRQRMVGVLLLLGLTACAGDQSLVNEVGALSELIGAQSEQVAELQQEVEDLNADLQAVRAELESGAAEHDEPMQAAGEDEHTRAASAFDVAVAQYLLDTAGFHAMDVALNEGGQIDPGYGSAVTRVHKVLSSTTWPEELESAAAGFLDRLGAFRAALTDDDLEAAAPLAAEIHELQHGLSHDIDAWLGAGGEHGHDE